MSKEAALKEAIKEIEQGKNIGTEAAMLVSYEKDKTVLEEEDWSTNYEVCTNIHVVPHKESSKMTIKARIVPCGETQTSKVKVSEQLKNKFGF